MKFFDNLRRQSAANRLMEEELYSEVARELNEGILRNGLWAMALQKAGGDKDKAKSLYIPLRVQSLKDEAEMEQASIEEETRRLIREQIAYEKVVKEEANYLAHKDEIQATKVLLNKGYKVIGKGTYWLVIEPLGGRVKHHSTKDLLEYANSRE